MWEGGGQLYACCGVQGVRGRGGGTIGTDSAETRAICSYSALCGGSRCHVGFRFEVTVLCRFSLIYKFLHVGSLTPFTTLLLHPHPPPRHPLPRHFSLPPPPLKSFRLFSPFREGELDTEGRKRIEREGGRRRGTRGVTLPLPAVR